MSYDGSCHCGAVEMTVEGDIPAEAMSCNCSHCRRKGLLLTFVPAETVEVRGEEHLELYHFNKNVIDHLFCPTCGVEPLARGKNREGSSVVMVNLRCVPEADLDGLKIKKVDGASF